MQTRAAVQLPKVVRLSLLVTIVSPAFAQSLTFGAKGGVPLTDNFQLGAAGGPRYTGTSSSKTRRYTVGPSIAVQLPRRFGIEVDALYRRLDYDEFSTGVGTPTAFSDWERTTGNRIDVPVLLRWSPFTRVYAVAGPVFGIHAGLKQRIHLIQDDPFLGPSDTVTTLDRRANSIAGWARESLSALVWTTLSGDFTSGPSCATRTGSVPLSRQWAPCSRRQTNSCFFSAWSSAAVTGTEADKFLGGRPPRVRQWSGDVNGFADVRRRA